MSPDAKSDFLLDEDAEVELTDCLAQIRTDIIARARALSTGRRITREEIHRAHLRMIDPNPGVLTAQRIVSTALVENRVFEWIAYSMAALLFTGGLLLLLYAMLAANARVQIAGMISGTILEVLLLFPIRMAVNARRHNIAIRMLGILLDRVHDPQKLSQILVKNFRNILFPSAIGLEG